MTLLSTWALGLLGLSAVVIVVYFLKRQARRVVVSHLTLWEGMERRPRSALRLRWTQLLGLLLQLLALSALVLGVAEPVLERPASGAKTLALVLDGSASMRARLSPQGPMRYQRAIEKAREVLRENAGAQVALFEAATPSRMLVPPTRDHGEMERVLKGWQPGYSGNALLAELLSLVEGPFKSPPERVVFITDRPLPPDSVPPGWEIHTLMQDPAENLAITRFVVRLQPNNRGFALLLSVWNGSPQPQDVRVQVLTGENELVAEHTLEVPPQGEETLTTAYATPPPQQLVARLVLPEGAEDAWPEDNVRYAAPPVQRPGRVRWEGEPSFYLERFLQFSGLAEILPAAPEPKEDALDPDAEEGIPLPDWTLYHGVPNAEAQAGRFLLVRSGMAPWVQLGEPVKALHLPVRATQDHPLLAGLDPTSWRLVRVPQATLDPAGTVLLRAGDVPILYLYEALGVRIAYLGVDLSASNIGLSLDFPILLYRLLQWLAPPARREAQLLIGEELPLTALDIESLEITRPDGRTCRPQPDRERDACAVVDRPGFYTLSYRESGLTQTFAANPPSAESYEISAFASVEAQGSAAPGSAGSASGTTVTSAVQPLWPWLLLAGLLLLVIEWLYAEGLLAARAFARTLRMRTQRGGWRRRRPP